MRVFTFISKRGKLLPIAQRIANEGHRVIFYINDQDCQRVGDGLVNKHKLPDPLVKDNVLDTTLIPDITYPKPDCIIMDSAYPGFGQLAEAIREQGIPVIGSSKWQEMLRNNPDYHTKVRDGMGFAKDKVNKGIDLRVELWFNGKDVVSVNYSRNEYLLMERDKGPWTPNMGSSVWVGDIKSKVCEVGISKIIPLLKKVNYIGPVSLDSFVGKEGFLRFNLEAGFRFDSLFPLLEMYRGRINDLFYGLATGVLTTMMFRSNLAMGIKLAVSPYPMSECYINPYIDTPLLGVNKFNLKHLWFYDVYKKDKEYLISGNGGDVATVTARGDEVQGYSPLRDAKRRIMRTINNLYISSVMYRSDIGNKVDSERAELNQLGWL